MILGSNRWGQLSSGTLHTLNLYSPCLSGHKNMALELSWLSENRTSSTGLHYRAEELSTENELV